MSRIGGIFSESFPWRWEKSKGLVFNGLVALSSNYSPFSTPLDFSRTARSSLGYKQGKNGKDSNNSPGLMAEGSWLPNLIGGLSACASEPLLGRQGKFSA